MAPKTQLHIPIRFLFTVLAGCVLALLILDSMPAVAERIRGRPIPAFAADRVYLSREANIPTWFSTVLLFSIAATAFANHRLEGGGAPADRLRRRFWLIVAIAFAYFSLDEAAQLHEMIDNLSRGAHKWVFFYAPFAAAFFLICVYYLIWVRRDDRQLQLWIVGGMAVYIGGGLGAEYISHISYFAPAMQHVEVLIEEGMEMIGASMVLMGCLHEFQGLFNARFSRRS